MIVTTPLLPLYHFLNGQATVKETEAFIYKHKKLEKELGEELYLELVNLDFKDKDIPNKLRAFILERIVDEGTFETWKLRTVLEDFLQGPENAEGCLVQLYNMYCGTHQENGPRRYAYKFLGNLGLNYLALTETEGVRNLGPYYSKMKPLAEEILKAIEENKIRISNNGTYVIADELKKKMDDAGFIKTV